MSSSNRTATVVPVTKNVNEGNSIADLTITGTITVYDSDSGQNKPKSSTIVGTYGTFQVSTSGTWTYTPTSALNQLTAGQTVKETFTVTSFDGSDTGTVTINITGTNDVPTMTSATSDVTEGATAAAISANGKITVTDLDTGESYAKPATVTTSYGTFAVDKNGNWTYVANSAHNELTAGQKVVETFTVTSQDNTKTSTVTVNITGTNDVATVTSDTKALVETNSASSISSSGKLTVADADTGEALVTASTVNTTYGKFTVDTNGNWTYVANDAHNELTAGQAVKEEFTVTSKDGTASGKVTINITGANDVASVTSATKELTETNSAADLSTSGKLTVADADAGQAYVTPQTVKGTMGTFTVDANGNWSYTADSAHNELLGGQVVTETFTVASQDKSASGKVTINITGTNDVAVVSSDTADLTETNDAIDLSVVGKLSITDGDNGQAFVQAYVKDGALGTFAIDTEGNWSYTASSAHDELYQGQAIKEEFTVVSEDGLTSSKVTVNIVGTNDAPVLSVSTDAVEIQQGIWNSVEGIATATATDADTGHTLTYALVDNADGYFTIDEDSGVIGLTHDGAAAIADKPEGPWVVQVQATDDITAESNIKEIQIDVKMAVADDTATLPGNINDWNIQPGTVEIGGTTTDGFIASRHDDDTIAVKIPDSVSTLNFDNGSMGLAHNQDGAGVITDATPAETGSHTITIAPGTTENTVVVIASGDMAPGSTTTVVGSTDSEMGWDGELQTYRSDTVQVVDAAYADATITTDHSNQQVTVAVGDTKIVLQDVETVQFTDATVRVVGAGGYATVADAQADAGADDVVYFSPLTNNTAPGAAEGATIEDAGLTATGQLSASQTVAGAETVTWAVTATDGTYGSIEIDSATGAWKYTLANDATAVQELNAGAERSDSFVAVATDGQGGTVEQTVVVSVTGKNDAAVITGVATAELTETDLAQTTGGKLDIEDKDLGEAAFVAQTDVDGSNGHGAFTIAEDGTWSYVMKSAHDEFVAGQDYTDSITVKSVDGVEQVLAVTIAGSNDVPTVTSDSADLTETDLSADISASGTVSITEADAGESHVRADSQTTDYGTFEVGTDGAWTYTALTAHNELTDGQAIKEEFTVVSQDGTASGKVTINITGSNDVPTVTSESVDLTETDLSADISTSGKVTAIDADTGESHVRADSQTTDYGTFEVDVDGNWVYTANSAHDELTAGQAIKEEFTVVSQDGTASSTVTINITGSNDIASVTSATVDLTETNDSNDISVAGKLDTTDLDADQAYVKSGTQTGDYGTFEIDADGNWTYTASSAHDELADGQIAKEQFTVESLDGSTSSIVTINIAGTNDAAEITGTSIVLVTETNGVLDASGTLSATDIDSSPDFVTQTAVDGSNGFGKFSIDADGNWTYTANATHDNFKAGTDYTDSITVATTDGTEQVVSVVIRGTNDSAEITGVSTGAIVEADTALSTGGKLDVSDVDSTAEFVAQTDVAGTYGTFSIDADGAWTYVANNAYDGLAKDEVIGESFTVATADGTETTIDVSITGTNDAPVLAATHAVTVTQGAGAVDNLETVRASDIDGPAGAVRYSLVSTFDGMFTIDAQTGKIGLTQAGAETISGLHESGVVSKYTLGVTATDGLNVSTQENITVNVDMAVDGTSASLPGSISEWTIAAQAAGGYVLTNTADPLIKVTLPGSVNTLSFDGQSVELANNGTLGTITDKTVAGVDHTIVIAPGTAESDLIVLSKAGVQTVVGAEDAGGRTDAIKIDYTLDVSHANSVFSVVDSGHIVLHTGTGSTVISDVESVQFNNATVRVVGAGGYASLTEASTGAADGTVIYIADASLATGANGVINHSNLSIYIANGDGATMTFGTSVVDPEVRIYGEHSFNINGSAGNDTIQDYTLLSGTQVNTINGMDGNDMISVHENGGKHIVNGGGGADTLVGGTGAQLLGGDGNDIIMAVHGAAVVSGGAGNDILLNAYAAGAVTLTGGSGNDTFAQIAGSGDTGTMKTIVSDLSTGDVIDLSFLERAGTNTSVDTVADFTAAGGKATMTTAGTTLDFGTMVVSGSESNADINSSAKAGTMIVSNATLTKVSGAINAGHDTLSAIDYGSTFGHLTDTYMHTA